MGVHNFIISLIADFIFIIKTDPALTALVELNANMDS